MIPPHDRIGQNPAALGQVSNRLRPRRQIRLHRLFEMKDKTGFGQQIGIPIAYPWRTRDIGAPTNPAKSNFHALGLATLAPNGRNINRFVLIEGLLNCCVHNLRFPFIVNSTPFSSGDWVIR